jgi:hypothetical protein
MRRRNLPKFLPQHVSRRRSDTSALEPGVEEFKVYYPRV